MAEQPEGAKPAGQPEVQKPPTPELSEGSQVKGPEVPDAGTIADKVLEKLKAELDPILDRKVEARFLSAKDKRLAKVDEIAEWIKKAGGDVQKVLGDMTLQELQARVSELEGQRAGAAPGGAAEAGDDKTAEILTEAGIAFDDPRVVDLAKQYNRKIRHPSEWHAALATNIIKWQRQGATKPGAVAVEGGAATAATGDVDRLTSELSALTVSGADVKKIEAKAKELREAIGRK